jgi:hypothetical protein
VKLLANSGDDPPSAHVVNDAAAAVGELMMGFACFLVAAISPFVLYRLMPTVEGAVAASGIAGGWARSALSTAQAGMIARGLGESAATRRVAGAASAASQGGPGGQAGASPAQVPAVRGLAAATGSTAGVPTTTGAETQRAGGSVPGKVGTAGSPGDSGGSGRPAQAGSSSVLTDGRPPGADRPGVQARRPTPATTSSTDDGDES